MAEARFPWRALAGWCAVALAAWCLYLAVGSVPVPFGDLLRTLFHAGSGRDAGLETIVWQIRMPRALYCVGAGTLLAYVGTVFQALFRNPLSEPYVIGVASGAAVGGTTAVLVALDSGLGRVGFSALGAVLSLGFVLAISKGRRSLDVQTLLIGGVVAGSLLSGWTTLNLVLAGQDSGKVLWWLLGSTTPMFWDRALVLAAVAVVGFLLLYRTSRALNAMAVDEFVAGTQGVQTQRLKLTALVVGAVATGVVVGTVGMVGFVGLVAPHIARRMVGNDVRVVMPVSAAIGCSLLLCADLLAQRLKPGYELPLGAVTAVLGAPVLLWLLRSKGRTALPS